MRNQRILRIGLLVSAWMLAPLSAECRIIDIQLSPSSGMDTFLSRGGDGTEYRANQNRGGEPVVVVGQTGNGGQFERTLIEFPLPALLPGEHVVAASLSLTAASVDPSHTIEILRLKQSWIEGTQIADVGSPDGATWQTFDSINPWPGISGFRTLDGGAFSSASAEIGDPLGSGVLSNAAIGTVSVFDLKPIKIQQWLDGSSPNDGMLIYSHDEQNGSSSQAIASRENTTGLAGPLLTITTVPEPTTFTLIGLGLMGIALYGWFSRREKSEPKLSSGDHASSRIPRSSHMRHTDR